MFIKEFTGDTPWIHLDIAGNRVAGRRQAVGGERRDGRGCANIGGSGDEIRHEVTTDEHR